MNNFKSIHVDQISIPDDRTRSLDEAWVELLAESIAEQGLIHPISVWPSEDGYTLISGYHRLAAFKSLEHDKIPAHIREYSAEHVDHIRLEEVAENVIRNELTALDRAHSLYDLDGIYKRLYPGLKQGGDRKSIEAQNQTALNAVRSELFEKVGLSERSFRIAVAIWRGLSPTSRIRINGTWMADHRASLMLMAEQKPAIQKDVLDLLFADEPKAKSVADALIIVTGKRLVPAAEKRIVSTQSNLAAMNKNQRLSVFSLFEDDIREWAELKGWFDG